MITFTCKRAVNRIVMLKLLYIHVVGVCSSEGSLLVAFMIVFVR